MCYKKHTYYKTCSHTRTEEEDCPDQKRLSQQRLQERLDTRRRRRRSSWLLCIFCFLIAPEPRPRTPEPSRRACPLRDLHAEVDAKCPQCRLLDAQAAAVGTRDRYEYDYAARRCRVRGEEAGGEMNAVADLVSAQVVDLAVPMDEAVRREGTRGRAGFRGEDQTRMREPERIYVCYRPEGRRDTDASAGSRRPKRGRDFVPYVDPASSGSSELLRTPHMSSPESALSAWPAPLRISKTKPHIKSPDRTSSACPAPLRISKTKQNQGPSRPTQTQHLKSPEPASSTRPAPLRVSRTKQNQDLSRPKRGSYSKKPGRSAVAALENPPLSVVMEDVEKAWNDACPPAGSSAAGKPLQQGLPPLTSPTPYSPELPIDDLIDEVELLWRRAGCSNDGSE